MEQDKSLDPQLWRACAGSMVKIPSLNSTIFYFPQGHREHAHAPPNFHAPRLPPLILCRVVAVKLLADAETDEVSAKISLLPQPETNLYQINAAVPSPDPPDGDGSEKPVFFTKSLTYSDTNKGGELSLPRNCAETIFPWLDYKADRPGQTVIAKDIHGKTWKFRHIYSGRLRRHLLTTGWSTFVDRKKLIARDLIVFLRSESGDLCVGIRHAKSDLLGSSSPHTGVSGFHLAMARAGCGQSFEVVYYPRVSTPEFCVKAADVRAAMSIQWCTGMRFKMAFEKEDLSGVSWFMGTVSAVQDADPIRWPDSPWRLLQVEWDKQDIRLVDVKRVSPWLVKLTPASLSSRHPGKKPGILPPFGTKFPIFLPLSRSFPGDSGPGSLHLAYPFHKETECILVFSCNDKDVDVDKDEDETLFVETISEKLQALEVTPLTYNLSCKKNIDKETLHRSGVGILVLSNSYAYARQSLDHLVAIMEHWKAKNLVIIPIYFKVTLSDICRLEGSFEAAFLQSLDSDQPGRVQKWKAAMAEIASIDGHNWTKETQVMLAEEVVRNACLRLHLKNSKNMASILALLEYSQPPGADFMGIWGAPGLGKTSIAREIFGALAPQYDLCYYVQDFYLMCQTRGLRQMRDDFYSKVFGEEKLSIGSSDIKLSFMRDLFYKKRILIVLDDVSNARDAEAAVGGFGWFSHGHRIILTSRRKQVLVQCKVKEPYRIQKLCESESFRLCKQYLSVESGIISELLSCSSGIPLALKVLGSTVSKQHVSNMKEHLQSLRRNPPTQIQEAFRRSFDALDDNEKNIFLDLTCFFRGENKDYVVQLLDACGFRTYLGICDLIDESLITLVDSRIEIPTPFQDIGRFIVYEEGENPCERSRLWDSKDIADVLTNNLGTEVIEGIFLDASDLNCELSPTVFGKMYRLRLLKLYCSTYGNQCKLSLPQGLDTLPDELRLLHWENYPLKYLPQKFNPENLVEVNMPYSNMEKLWEGKKDLVKLKKINLSHSRNLTDILMLSEALNLEHIDLEGCTSLVDVSTSIPRSGKLVSLNMKDCIHLRSLPTMVDLTFLKLLNMSGCSELEEIQDFAPNLKELYLAGIAIRQLPTSIENLTELGTLDLENCRMLQQLPSGLKNSRCIVELKLSGCTSLVGLRSMGTSVNSPLPLPSLKRDFGKSSGSAKKVHFENDMIPRGVQTWGEDKRVRNESESDVTDEDQRPPILYTYKRRNRLARV
ncbi:unnamed protein product [Thlaspi arvense]|uniref:Auxin response factor n=1 Tax=Thlaspi arvense TaxID=13288 RepID=A0AAU9T5M2_THLAR|nr:unnamed protein product [Thlaspi arvense]